MYSIINIDGKESNTTKGVNIGTEINKFKNNLYKKKIIRHKMRRMGSYKMGTNIKWEHTKSTKYHYHVSMIKDLL